MKQYTAETFDIYQSTIQFDEDIIKRIKKLTEELPSSLSDSYRGELKQIDQNYPWLNSIFQQSLELVQQKNPNVGLSRSWINIHKFGQGIDWHSHDRDGWVSVIYLKTPKNSGLINFRKGSRTFSIDPNPGDILIFPGTLDHSVENSQSQKERISIACNYQDLKKRR